MISNHHSRRFDPRWLPKPLKIDWDELMEAVDASLGFAATESKNNPNLRDFDEALEQIVSEKCKVCPLCGANVDRDKTVVIRDQSGPDLATIRPGSIQLGDRGVPGLMAARPPGRQVTASESARLRTTDPSRPGEALRLSCLRSRGCDLQTVCLIPGRSAGTALLRRRGRPFHLD